MGELEQRRLVVARWALAREAGLRVELQSGLIPLGRDRGSRLWEFAHLASGRLANWKGDITSGRVEPTTQMGLVLVLLPGGRFWMGAEREGRHNADPDALPAEAPVREAGVAPFFLSKYQMTQAQWRRLLGRDRSTFRYAEDSLMRPVENVSWDDCQRLSEVSDLRLPSETEWEYGARAKTETPWSFAGDRLDLRRYANHGVNSGGQTLPVGSKLPNDFGLHDVHGNVYEWCENPPGGDDVGAAQDDRRVEAHATPYRVARGGCWSSEATSCRSAYRVWYVCGLRSAGLGLRPARSLR